MPTGPRLSSQPLVGSDVAPPGTTRAASGSAAGVGSSLRPCGFAGAGVGAGWPTRSELRVGRPALMFACGFGVGADTLTGRTPALPPAGFAGAASGAASPNGR